jgi:CRISPR-associated protein Csd2
MQSTFVLGSWKCRAKGQDWQDAFPGGGGDDRRDVANGNPNGDPDAGNLPRMDPETGQGLVSDVSIKRKIRNFVADACNGKDGHAIYVTENAILNDQHRKAYRAIRPEDKKVETAKTLSPQNDPEAAKLREWMCANFFDVRAFGAVMSTGINCGQVRGPLQFVFGRSIEAIMPLEISITRMAATNEAEKKKRSEGLAYIGDRAKVRATGGISCSLTSC